MAAMVVMFGAQSFIEAAPFMTELNNSRFVMLSEASDVIDEVIDADADNEDKAMENEAVDDEDVDHDEAMDAADTDDRDADDEAMDEGDRNEADKA